MKASPEKYTITLQPNTGLYALRGRKAILLGTFATYAEAEAYAKELSVPEKQWRRSHE